MEGAVITIFCPNCDLTVTKSFLEEPFCVSEKLWYRGMLGIKDKAGVMFFSQTSLVSQYRIIS